MKGVLYTILFFRTGCAHLTNTNDVIYLPEICIWYFIAILFTSHILMLNNDKEKDVTTTMRICEFYPWNWHPDTKIVHQCSITTF